MSYYLLTPLFDLGEILVSYAVRQLQLDYTPMLRRHHLGDWGNVSPSDCSENDRAVIMNEEILSQFEIESNGASNVLVIMTERDRSYTVIFILDEPEPPEAHLNLLECN